MLFHTGSFKLWNKFHWNTRMRLCVCLHRLSNFLVIKFNCDEYYWLWILLTMMNIHQRPECTNRMLRFSCRFKIWKMANYTFSKYGQIFMQLLDCNWSVVDNHNTVSKDDKNDWNWCQTWTYFEIIWKEETIYIHISVLKTEGIFILQIIKFQACPMNLQIAS